MQTALAELRRRKERKKLNQQVQQQDRDRQAALVRLGQTAWERKAGLSRFPELSERLARIEEHSGQQTAHIAQTEGEKAALEGRQKAENAKYDASRKAVEDQKRPVDASLQAARQNERNWQKTIERSASRQSSVFAELGVVEQQRAAAEAAPAPDQASKIAAAEVRRQQLEAERANLTAQLAEGQQSLRATQAEVARLAGESQRYQAEIDRIEAERQAALAPVVSELQRISAELNTLRQQAGVVAGARTAQLQALGAAIYESGAAVPGFAQEIAQIAASDSASATMRQALQNSLALTQTVPPGTMAKFWSTVILLPLLFIGLGIAGYAVWNWRHEKKLVTEFQIVPKPVNPYLSHPLQEHPAYVLAQRLARSRNEHQVQQLMLEAFGAIHLGVYTHDGGQVLAGAETSPKDFFLYDFQWKTLAHAYSAHNLRDLSHHHALLGKALLNRDDSAQVEAALNKAIVARYQAAVQAPDDPASYLILLVDGLARNQIKPYSLSEIPNRPGADLLVDPLQSFLIMLDFFVQPPSAAQSRSRWWDWQLVPCAHAQSGCDGIVGNSGERGWGFGVKLVGLGVGALGKATQVTSALGDLILLYGVTINISPTGYTIHLTHDEKSTDSFIAMVTFNPENIPKEAISCGWLAGKIMPQAGEHLKDVELTWNIEPVWPSYLLVTHETVNELSGHLGFQTKTDSDGQSIFTIEATDCPHKTDGNRVVGRDLMMSVSARMLTNKLPMPGTLGWISILSKLGPSGIEYLMNGCHGYCRFRAEWHDKSKERPQRSGD